MKTYYFFYLLLIMVITGCSKSDNGAIDETPEEIGEKTTYTLLVKASGKLKAKPFDANLKTLTLKTEESSFTARAVPDLMFREGSTLTMYRKTGDCLGVVTKYDFDDHSSKEIDVFADLGTCTLTVNGIAHSEKAIYIGYELEVTSKDKSYFVRVIDTEASEASFVDVELTKKPLQMVVAKSRLFILNIDEEITNENGLNVMDIANNALIHEMNLGYNAKQVLVDKNKDVIISYDNLHTVLNSTTFGVQYFNYESGKEPKFSGDKTTLLKGDGKLYYERPTGESTHPNIPAIFDFPSNTIFLYIYENFLTQAQIESDFEIGDTTMVGYDEKNNLLLIGYKKTGSSNGGGLIRVKPVPEPAFIDNIDLDGVPYDVYIK